MSQTRGLPGLAAVLAGVSLLLCAAGQSKAEDRAKTAVVILPFAIAGANGSAGQDGSSGTVAPAGTSSASSCPAGVTVDLAKVAAEDQTGVIAVVAAELQAHLVKDGLAAQVGVPGATVPAGAVVLTGCFTTMDEGSARKRIVGAGMGGSTLAAQVQILRVVDGKPVVLLTFAEESKGRNFGVGSGMLINALRAKRTSLQGDAGNLADKIAKEFEKREKELK